MHQLVFVLTDHTVLLVQAQELPKVNQIYLKNAIQVLEALEQENNLLMIAPIVLGECIVEKELHLVQILLQLE
jgi:hypothetical protein